jgi:hypothetical protein
VSAEELDGREVLLLAIVRPGVEDPAGKRTGLNCEAQSRKWLVTAERA